MALSTRRSQTLRMGALLEVAVMLFLFFMIDIPHLLQCKRIGIRVKWRAVSGGGDLC